MTKRYSKLMMQQRHMNITIQDTCWLLAMDMIFVSVTSVVTTNTVSLIFLVLITVQMDKRVKQMTPNAIWQAVISSKLLDLKHFN
jgi:hypothetical protein